MKKILIILTLITGLTACENQEFSFPDFDYTGGYFPYQYPVRTLVLGDDIYDNSNDNNHKFLISAAMGGVYKNTKDRVFDIRLAPELCSNAKFESTGENIHLMPQNYYTLASNRITIPAGEVNGSVEVQLTDAFFNDPLAIRLGYVIPLRLVGSSDEDTILQGKAIKPNPDPRVAGDWEITPKDFTMFAVKYVNKYHGNYLHRGASILKDPSGVIIENPSYHAQYLVKNEIWKLSATGKNQVSLTGTTNSSTMPGVFQMDLSFADNGTCTVRNPEGAAIPVTGTGKFVQDGDEWGGKKRNVIILSYNYSKDYFFIPYNPPPPDVPVVTVNNKDASIKYTGSWTHNAEAACYNGDRSYSGTAGDYFTFNFTGDGIALYWKTGSSYGSFDVYLNDVKVGDNVSTKTSSTLYQQKLFETSCIYGSYTLKVVLKQNTNTIFDYLVYTSLKPPPIMPDGTYTFEAKDTLVVRDRATVMEVYKPVVSN